MQLKSCIVIIALSITCLFLTSCMSNNTQNYNQDYTAAKQNFDKHDYQTAFKKLQAPAKAGNPNAQYALGYLYYYGQGTTTNRSKAKYWFQQAAKKGQAKAQNALKTMGE